MPMSERKEVQEVLPPGTLVRFTKSLPTVMHLYGKRWEKAIVRAPASAAGCSIEIAEGARATVVSIYDTHDFYVVRLIDGTEVMVGSGCLELCESIDRLAELGEELAG